MAARADAAAISSARRAAIAAEACLIFAFREISPRQERGCGDDQRDVGHSRTSERVRLYDDDRGGVSERVRQPTHLVQDRRVRHETRLQLVVCTPGHEFAARMGRSAEAAPRAYIMACPETHTDVRPRAPPRPMGPGVARDAPRRGGRATRMACPCGGRTRDRTSGAHTTQKLYQRRRKAPTTSRSTSRRAGAAPRRRRRQRR